MMTGTMTKVIEVTSDEFWRDRTPEPSVPDVFYVSSHEEALASLAEKPGTCAVVEWPEKTPAGKVQTPYLADGTWLWVVCPPPPQTRRRGSTLDLDTKFWLAGVCRLQWNAHQMAREPALAGRKNRFSIETCDVVFYVWARSADEARDRARLTMTAYKLGASSGKTF